MAAGWAWRRGLAAVWLTLGLAAGCAVPPGNASPDQAASDKPSVAAPAIRGWMSGEQAPDWLAPQLREWAAGPVNRVPTAVWRFERDGRTMYYIPQPCCDRFDLLYAADGELLCAPGGGFTGRGDGRCPGALPPLGQMVSVWRHPLLQVRKSSAPSAGPSSA